MAEARSSVTYIQYVEVGDSRTVLSVPTHILPTSHRNEGGDSYPPQACSNWEEKRSQPYAWFNDRCNQEVLVGVHEIIYTKAVENLLLQSVQTKATSSTNGQPYTFRRSGNLRMLFTFRPVENKQHLLLFSNEASGAHGLVRRAAFMSEYGRRVLPCLDAATYGGCGYSAFKVLPEAFHVYVDNLEVTSPNGIFKMLRTLAPKHTLSLDIPSYFKTVAEEDSSQVLPQVPLSGLNVNRRGAKPSTSRAKTGRGTRQKAMTRPQQQPTILKAFEKYQEAMRQKEMDEYDLPKDILEDVWNFDSSQPTSETSDSRETGCCPATDDDGAVSLSSDGKKEVESTARSESIKPGGLQQWSTTVNIAQSTNSENVKGKLSLVKEQPVAGMEPDSDDPFDQLFADQTRKTSRTNLRATRNLWMRIEDTDDDDEEGEEEEEKKEPSVSNVPATSSVSHTILSSHAKQQHNGRSSRATREPISANLSLLCDYKAKDIDMTSDASTADFEMSASEDSTGTQESHFLPSRDIDVPRSAKQSASQPVSCSVGVERERNLSRRTTSHSISLAEVEEFSDITNTVVSPTKGGHSSAGKDTSVSVRRSIVDLTRKSVSKQQQSDSVIQKKKKRKPLPASGAEIFRGTKKVVDLSRQQLSDWMRLNQPLLMNIFKRKHYSWRHEEFNTNPKARAAMKWQYDSRRFTEDQVKLITDILLKIFCWRHMKYFNYVMSVLLPEALTRVIADVHHVDFDEAEKLMFNFEGQASVDLTAD